MHGDAVGRVRLPGQEVSVRGLRLSRFEPSQSAEIAQETVATD